jgi:hypothetical protein
MKRRPPARARTPARHRRPTKAPDSDQLVEAALLLIYRAINQGTMRATLSDLVRLLEVRRAPEAELRAGWIDPEEICEQPTSPRAAKS